jgi:hypothetical protein
VSKEQVVQQKKALIDYHHRSTINGGATRPLAEKLVENPLPNMLPIAGQPEHFEPIKINPRQD